MPGTSLSISRESVSLRFQVTSVLRDSILAGEFAPGMRLVERELCARLGVSRALLREALQHLQAEGLVDIVPHRGPSVAVIGEAEARDIYSVRQQLERLVVEEFCRHGTQAQLARLSDVLEQLRLLMANAEMTRALRVKNEFYDILLEGCGNRIVGQILRQLHNRVTLLRRFSLAQPGRLQGSFQELEALTAALSARDAQRAGQLCVEHIQHAFDAAMRSFADGLHRGE